jgi:hypothetical protein
MEGQVVDLLGRSRRIPAATFQVVRGKAGTFDHGEPRVLIFELA